MTRQVPRKFPILDFTSFIGSISPLDTVTSWVMQKLMRAQDYLYGSHKRIYPPCFFDDIDADVIGHFTDVYVDQFTDTLYVEVKAVLTTNDYTLTLNGTEFFFPTKTSVSSNVMTAQGYVDVTPASRNELTITGDGGAATEIQIRCITMWGKQFTSYAAAVSAGWNVLKKWAQTSRPILASNLEEMAENANILLDGCTKQICNIKWKTPFSSASTTVVPMNGALKLPITPGVSAVTVRIKAKVASGSGDVIVNALFDTATITVSATGFTWYETTVGVEGGDVEEFYLELDSVPELQIEHWVMSEPI